jgi:hypothetical protein
VNDNERGKIRNRDHVPTKDFSGLRYGKITPTDIDGFMEFGDRTFIFIELKFGDAVLKYGQKLAMERLCDACESDQRTSIALVARYNTQGEDAVDVAPLPVSEYRINRKWHKPKNGITVRQAIDQILTWHPQGGQS